MRGTVIDVAVAARGEAVVALVNMRPSGRNEPRGGAGGAPSRGEDNTGARCPARFKLIKTTGTG